VTVGICAIIGNLNKSVTAFAKFPSFKIDLKIARDVNEKNLSFEIKQNGNSLSRFFRFH
jgi:hypothetical protein